MGSLGVEPSEDGVWVLTLDNEPRRNAVDPEMLQALDRACADASAQGARCLVLTGKGDRAFCAGYDLNTLKESAPDDPLPDVLLHLASAALERTSPPVIAALNGVAIGAGGELAMACDLRIAAASARISMPPAKLGIVYSPAGLQRFVELCGLAHAKRLFFTGDPVGADEALKIGLVDEVVPEGLALGRALELARRIAANAPLAVQGMKRLFALMRRRELPDEARAEAEALRRESFASEDAREGVAAMLEKRSPVFRGRVQAVAPSPPLLREAGSPSIQPMFFERLGPAWEAYRGELRRQVRVIVVDDEEMVRELLMEIVRLAGYEVEGCATGERALDRVREVPFDLLLTDKNLPGLSGIELVARVRAAGLDLPAVVITGYPSGETLAEALTAGAADYISKPFDLHHVKARIGSIIDQRLSALFYDRMVADLKGLVRDAGASKAILDQIGAELFRFKRALAQRPAVLILEATPRDAVAVRDYLAREGVAAKVALPDMSARAVLEERPLVVEVSLGVPGAIDLVRHLRSADPLLEVIASGRPARLDDALEAVAAGASDYVLHSEGLPALGTRLGRALSRARRQHLYLHLIATLYRAARRLGDKATELLQDAVPASQRETLERLIASVEPPGPVEEEIDLGDLLDES